MNTPYGVMIRDLKENFNTSSIIYYVKHHVGYTNIWIFGVPNNREYFARDFVLHQRYFMKYLLYFIDKASALIKEANRTRFEIPAGSIKLVNINANIDKQFSESSEFEIKKYHLQGEFGDIALTYREVACLNLLKQGLRYKEIGKRLYISTRTVEQRIDKIRKKLHCASKKDLLCKMSTTKIMDIINGPIELRQAEEEVMQMKGLFEDKNQLIIEGVDS